MSAFAGFGGGNVARNGFEKIDGRLAKMGDELRGGDGIVFALGVGPGHEIGRDDEFERFGANAGAIGDDEIAKAEERFVFLPHGNIEEGVGADDEKDAIAVIGVAEITDGVDGIVKLIAGEIVAGFGERWDEVRMLGAGERDHGEAMRKRRKVLLEFVRGTAGRNEMNFVEIEAAIGGASDGEVAIVDGIERAAKERDAARMMSCGGAVGLSGGQCVSEEDACSLFCCGSCSKSSAECVTLGILSRASAMARTSSLTPSPVGAEMEWKGRLCFSQKARSSLTRVGSEVASSFEATTIMGFSERDSLKAFSSPVMTSKE